MRTVFRPNRSANTELNLLAGTNFLAASVKRLGVFDKSPIYSKKNVTFFHARFFGWAVRKKTMYYDDVSSDIRRQVGRRFFPN